MDGETNGRVRSIKICSYSLCNDVYMPYSKSTEYINTCLEQDIHDSVCFACIYWYNDT